MERLSLDPSISFVEEAVFASDDGEFCYRSGRFSAYCASTAVPALCEPGPQAVPVDEAIAWARRHAPVVIVCVGDDRRYSAGDTDPAGEHLPSWPRD